jgi:hypothetical protein
MDVMSCLVLWFASVLDSWSALLKTYLTVHTHFVRFPSCGSLAMLIVYLLH